jgi:Uma2 family endonuclease
VRSERLDELTEEQWQRFLPLCPDFVLELRSPSDSINRLKEKMLEYCRNGAQLGWLIDPVLKRVHVYHSETNVEVVENPATVSAAPLLRGFVLDLRRLWAAMERKKS